MLFAKITDCPCVTCMIKYIEQHFAKMYDFRHISLLLDFGLVRLWYNRLRLGSLSRKNCSAILDGMFQVVAFVAMI